MKKFFWLLPLALLAGACSKGAADPAKVGASACAPVDYAHGVFYFPCTDADFANGLSNYLRDHPNLEVTSTTGNGTGGYGYDIGYFVTMKTTTPAPTKSDEN